MMEREKFYFHVCTDGNFLPWMFRDEEDFIIGVNRIAICTLSFRIRLLAYSLMDNHVHFILNGTHQECKKFIVKYKVLTSKWIKHKYKIPQYLNRIPTTIKKISDTEALMESIAYVDRNSIMAGFKGLPTSYPWGSAKYIYDFEVNDNDSYRKIKDLTFRKQRIFTHSHCNIPEDWIIDSNNMIMPHQFIDRNLVIKLFSSPARYIYFISKKVEGKIDLELKDGERTFIPDKDLRVIVQDICFELYKTRELRRLDINSRINLAKQIRRRYSSSTKQIARMVHLHAETLKGFV